MVNGSHEQVTANTTVHDFASRYVELDGKGRGPCPFHDDQVKRFSVNRREGYWNCFAAAAGRLYTSR